MKKFEACVQAIHFILKNFGEMDKLKIVKLIYFADKRQLIFAARTITGDNYVAMRHGPAGSMVLNILNRNTEYLEQEQLDFIDRYIRQVEAGADNYKSAGYDMSYDQLAETDRKALKIVCEKFKHADKWAVVSLTHKYPEWGQFENELKDDPSICKPIPLVDMFSCVDDDPLGIPPDIIKDSREMYLGYEPGDEN